MKASSQTAGWKGLLIKHGEKGVLGIIGALVLWVMFVGFKKEGLKEDKIPSRLVERVITADKYIATAFKLKTDNGGEKFRDEKYLQILDNGLQELKFDDKPYSFDPPEFPLIAKRSQPRVFAAEDVHATALVVQIAFKDEKAVKEQQGLIQALQDKKLQAELKKKQAEEQKKRAEELKKQRQAAQANNSNKGGGGGDGRPRSPLEKQQPAFPVNPQPPAMQPVVQQQPHPAIQNLTRITTATKGISVVTALIPYKKQIEEFNQTLVEGKDKIPDRKSEDDSPTIVTFVVERALVVNPNEPENKLVWTDISRESIDFFSKNGMQLNIVTDDPVVISLRGPQTKGNPKTGLLPWHTFSPLPMLADRKWQREVTHPRIPLLTDLTEEQIKREDANAFMPAAPIAGGNNFGQPAPVEPAGPIEHELPEYVLLRHIDFNVAPGATYRYRVSLVYQNPNVGLESKYLDSGAVTTEELKTAVSPASNSVSLSPLHQILAGGDLTYPRRSDALPTSRVWQWLIDIQRGGEVAKDFGSVAVGDLLDLTGTIKNILNRAAGQGEELVDYNFAQHKIPRGTQMPYLVDVFGREAPPPPRPPRPPVAGKEGATPPPPVVEAPREQTYSEILYVDQDGKLRSSTSTYAETLIDNYKLRYESMESTNANPAGGGDGMQPGPQPGGGNPLFNKNGG